MPRKRWSETGDLRREAVGARERGRRRLSEARTGEQMFAPWTRQSRGIGVKELRGAPGRCARICKLKNVGGRPERASRTRGYRRNPGTETHGRSAAW